MVWKGFDIWPAADGYTFLHSGRPLPDSGYAATKNKGVGILLDEMTSVAWRWSGEVWEAVSSRTVMATVD